MTSVERVARAMFESRNERKPMWDTVTDKIIRETWLDLARAAVAAMPEWQPIEGTSGKYEISREGLVRSVDRTIVRYNGTKQRFKSRVLTPFLNDAGYVCVRLSGERRGVHRLHRLLAEAFIPNQDDKPQVNHIDGVKFNFALGNLEWVTDKENKKHAWDKGLRDRSMLPIHLGEDKQNSKLTEQDVRWMRENYESSGRTLTAMSERFGVSKKTILDAVKGRSWKHLPPSPPESKP